MEEQLFSLLFKNLETKFKEVKKLTKVCVRGYSVEHLLELVTLARTENLLGFDL